MFFVVQEECCHTGGVLGTTTGIDRDNSQDSWSSKEITGFSVAHVKPRTMRRQTEQTTGTALGSQCTRDSREEEKTKKLILLGLILQNGKGAHSINCSERTACTQKGQKQ